MAEPTDAQEARKAKEHAQARLREARARQVKVSSIVGNLSRHLETNHFADLLAVAFGAKDGKENDH